MFAYALRQQKTKADLVCLVTDDVPVYARAPFELLFDHVVNVDRMMVSHPLRDRRTDRPFLFARLNALRLGLDGDLGFAYDKVALVDADILPLRCYDTLFDLDGPAGIINERKEHCVQANHRDRFIYPKSVYHDGTWIMAPGVWQGQSSWKAGAARGDGQSPCRQNQHASKHIGDGGGAEHA